MIIPFSLLYNLWTFIFLIALIYNIIYVPFSIGLDVELKGSFIILDVLMIILMIMDSVLRCYLAVNKQYEIEVD